MKNTLRILATAVMTLVMGYASAANAETVKPCKESTCTFAMTASATVGYDGHAVSITLDLVGNPLLPDLNHPNHPDYGITGASGTVVIDGTTHSGVSLIADTAGAGTKTAAPTGWSSDLGNLNYDNRLQGTGEKFLDTAGLLLEIPGLTESKKVNRVWETSDYWILEWHANNGGYYELQNSLVTADYYKLETLTATTTPEPVTLMLFGTGLAGIGGLVRRRLIG